jgi:hypothetical protein
VGKHVFDNHYRIVHQNTHHQRQRHQRHHVQRPAQSVKRDERGDNRQRHGNHHNHCAAQVVQKQETDNGDNQDSQKQINNHRIRWCAGENGIGGGNFEFHIADSSAFTRSATRTLASLCFMTDNPMTSRPSIRLSIFCSAILIGTGYVLASSVLLSISGSFDAFGFVAKILPQYYVAALGNFSDEMIPLAVGATAVSIGYSAVTIWIGNNVCKKVDMK